jgi:ribosome maturation factor RimP
MKLNKYIGKTVKIDLDNNYFYEGSVEKVDEDSISIIDKTGKWVDISNKAISFIREVSHD